MAQLELPEFVVKPSEDFKGWLLVTCPREDCADMFIVRQKTWVRPHTFTTRLGEVRQITGRACPYCFRAARVPARYTRRVTTTTRRQA